MSNPNNHPEEKLNKNEGASEINGANNPSKTDEKGEIIEETGSEISDNLKKINQVSIDNNSEQTEPLTPIETTSPSESSEVVKKKDRSLLILYILMSVAAVLLIIGTIFKVYLSQNQFKPVKLEAPIYSLESGTYTTPQEVEIENPNDNTTVYYTTDGTTPDEDSKEYTGKAIRIISTTTLKSVAIDKEGNRSPVTTEKFRISREGT